MRLLMTSTALALLCLVWLGPLPQIANQAFSAHMIMHVTVLAVAAPLLAFALAGSEWDPVPDRPNLFSPAFAAVLEFLIVWGWHSPGLHTAAREGGAMLALEQGSYLLAGVLVWLSAFGGNRQQRAAAGVAGLLITSMHMTLLGVLLALASRPLYHHGGLALFGWSALEDQQLGGVIMLLVGGASYLAGGLYLLAQLLNPPSLIGSRHGPLR